LLDQKVTKNQGKNKASRSGFLGVNASLAFGCKKTIHCLCAPAIFAWPALVYR